MPLLLLKLGAHPGHIVATKNGACSDDSAFFLDFSRPLRVERWLGVWNFHVGYAYALHVPVVHNAEHAGSQHIEVPRVDPYFLELRRLWQERFPTSWAAPAVMAARAKMEADFALHFAEDRFAGQ